MTISQFTGKTGIVGQVLQPKFPLIKRGRTTDSLQRLRLLSGPLGVGKTELAKVLAIDKGEHPLNAESRIGSNVSVEVIRDSVPQRPLTPAPRPVLRKTREGNRHPHPPGAESTSRLPR
jgi:replication-associated recombination protein RarA